MTQTNVSTLSHLLLHIFKKNFFLISDQKITEFVFLFPFILNEFFYFFYFKSQFQLLDIIPSVLSNVCVKSNYPEKINPLSFHKSSS